MEPITDPTLAALEWPRFISLAQKEARTEPAKKIILALESKNHWARDISTAKLLQQETQEVLPLLEKDALWGPLQDLPDPETALDRLSRGSVLEVEELALVRRWVHAIDSWVLIPREDIRSERLKKAMGALADPHSSLRILEKLLTPNGDLSENASPKLAALYAEIRAVRKEIGFVLDQLLKTFSQKGVLQENFTDVRDGRYVLPIKISAQGEVDGIIYEASASRQTVFVEPREVAGLNNRLRQRQNDLIQEIYNVLSAASASLKPFSPEIQLAVLTLTHWDAVQARARFGRIFHGKAIDVTSERLFLFKQTAHPLLWWSLDPPAIIKNEIEFGEPTRTLLITGPNTGGKTVLLKTLGLAGICARTGFPFPGTERAIIPFFDTFFADLGDPQSIEKHLSSFSGHIYRLKEILENVTGQSLVLVDELNSATDPEEGAALGRAFLEAVMEKGALIVTTTHDPSLKIAALADKRILNASMAFDETSRSPTYRMLPGVPGRSRALETAERLGLPQSVILKAKEYLSRGHVEFETLLSKLEADSQILTQAKKEAVAIREEAERLKKEWTEKMQSSVGDLLDRTRQKLRRLVEQAQDEIRASVQKLDEMKNRRQLDQTRLQINETFGEAVKRIDKALEEEAPEVAQTLARTQTESETPTIPARMNLRVGSTVRIPKWKAIGTVLEVTGNKIKVAMGTVQMSLGYSDVEEIEQTAPKKTEPTRRKILDDEPAPAPEIDLRGVRLDEAMSQLERYLDQAFRSGSIVEVTIIHGLGTGAIREGARKLLKGLPYIKEFRDAGLGRGGTGATLVEFDRD